MMHVSCLGLYMLVHGVRTFELGWVYIDAQVQETRGSKTPFYGVKGWDSVLVRQHHIPHVICPQFHIIIIVFFSIPHH